MSSLVQTGLKTSHPDDREGEFTIVAWHAPEYARRDRDTGKHAKLFPIKSIVVKREMSEGHLGRVSVEWSDGRRIYAEERAKFGRKLTRSIKKAIKETRRIAGR